MTRSEALALARAKWGDALVDLCYWPGRMHKMAGETHDIVIDSAPYVYSGTSWEAACKAAGLLPDTTEGR